VKQNDFIIDYTQHNNLNDDNNISKHLAAVMRLVSHQAWKLWRLHWMRYSVPSNKLAAAQYWWFLLCYWKWNLRFGEEICKQDTVHYNITAKNIRVVYARTSSGRRLKLICKMC